MTSASSWWSRSHESANEAVEKLKAEIARLLTANFDRVAGDVPGICADTTGCSVEEWRRTQIAKATGLGVVSSGVPYLGYAVMPGELMIVMRWMHRCAIGMCHIRLGYADEETFAGVLAVWSGAAELNNDLAKQVAAKVAATAGTTVGGQLGLKLSIKAFTTCASTIVAKKLGPLVAQKVASKIAAKLAAKATVSWIPVISAAAGGGINHWILKGVADAAEEYAAFIEEVSP